MHSELSINNIPSTFPYNNIKFNLRYAEKYLDEMHILCKASGKVYFIFAVFFTPPRARTEPHKCTS